MMTYDGPLYGKIGRRYIQLSMTSEDVDAEKATNAELRKKLFRAKVKARKIALGKSTSKKL